MAITTEKVAASPLVDGSTTTLHSHPGGGDVSMSKMAPTGDITIPTEYCAIVSGSYEVASGKYLELADGAVMEVT